jgi:hypothetical protein
MNGGLNTVWALSSTSIVNQLVASRKIARRPHSRSPSLCTHNRNLHHRPFVSIM